MIWTPRALQDIEKPCIRNAIVIHIDFDQYRHALKESALLNEVFELHQGLIDLRAPSNSRLEHFER